MTGGREILHYAAFTVDGAGGNPAGVVLDAAGLADTEMLAIAAEVGYSETAFLMAPPDASGRAPVRYFAPRQEVPFCGHATVALAVALAERGAPAELVLGTASGPVPVRTVRSAGGYRAELTSVPPTVTPAEPALVTAVLAALRWTPTDLDPDHPPAVAFAGARHLVLVTRTRERLAALDYDFETTAGLMRDHDLITLQLVWPEGPNRYHARNPFAGSGVVEDPATGAAAAALGAYLRHLGVVPAAAELRIRQGEDMGRPSELAVRLLADDPRVRVSGYAAPLAAAG